VIAELQDKALSHALCTQLQANGHEITPDQLAHAMRAVKDRSVSSERENDTIKLCDTGAANKTPQSADECGDDNDDSSESTEELERRVRAPRNSSAFSKSDVWNEDKDDRDGVLGWDVEVQREKEANKGEL
jgi:hypothetical protein